VDVELADTMPEGWQVWLNWYNTAHPNRRTEIAALEADQGQYLGYIRMVGRRREEAKLEEYCWPDTMRSLPTEYTKKPLLRTQEQG
jgi:hypothetical protein